MELLPSKVPLRGFFKFLWAPDGLGVRGAAYAAAGNPGASHRNFGRGVRASLRGALDAFPSVRQARLWEGWLREHRADVRLTFHGVGQEEDRIRQAGSLQL